MKNTLLSILVLALLAFTACKQAESSEAVEAVETVEVETEENVDHSATFEKRANILRALIKAHADEDLEALGTFISDTLIWSPPNYSENPWLGKDEYLAALKGYHDQFDNIRYTEGIVMPDNIGNGFFSGNAYATNGTSSSDANIIRSYGTWHATHLESGKEVGAKWFSVTVFNDDDKIALITEYWDVNGLAAQLAEE